jgi:uncharacterized damage-inducible protein DinB
MSTPASPSGSAFGSHLVTQLKFPYRMLVALCEDFSDEEARQPAGGNKALVWYLGHVTIAADYLLMLYTGAQTAISKENRKRFGRGSDGTADFSDAPSKDEMVALFKNVHKRLMGFLENLAPEDMEREATGQVVDPTFARLGTAISLIVAHDGYHAGQIAVLRRAMGKDPLFG